MKAVILAGGFGTRISEESAVRPKPMVEIGSEPILWHIMKIYAHHGINEFVVACGYKGGMIKEYFSKMFLSHSDVTFDLGTNSIEVHRTEAEPWRVTCVDTGTESMTGGRLRRVQDYLDNETFCMTYGDGVSDIDIAAEIEFHKEQGLLATMAAIKPPGRFGAFSLHPEEKTIRNFHEKPQGDGAWINGGFFVLEPKVIEYIDSDAEPWEQSPLQRLAKDGQLGAYRHFGFWHPMDTLRDKHLLEDHWSSGTAPWKVWN
ncbi:glucose-1-phosphate cytidylyltransferase [Pontiella sulfatireligans]|uniref:Glucose-1-phosphate cytidylyltransferase n=1 Tax=Pontiella sulfatireligans TaxID=2750658 RepID=A0A6C2UNA1_9BACT|nr:glucose-1-phosphate cytidylyltransferase [Pontiella sulfatireligans]VGO21658.1 Glucose-1-phosphate cytidylyltransferase [Pontiella sulfatireligans]